MVTVMGTATATSLAAAMVPTWRGRCFTTRGSMRAAMATRATATVATRAMAIVMVAATASSLVVATARTWRSRRMVTVTRTAEKWCRTAK